LVQQQEITWTDQPGALNGEVHIYACDITTLNIQSLQPLVTKEEAKKAGSFRQQADADRFITGRLITRKLLGYYGRIDPSQIIIRPGDNGKPAAHTHLPIVLPSFNISHSGHQVLIAICNEPVGIDVEQVKDIGLESLAEAVFSPHELYLFQTAADRVTTFYHFWTRKEALLKAMGVGLTDDLTLIDISKEADTHFVKQFTKRTVALVTFAMHNKDRYFASLCYVINTPARFIMMTNEWLSQL
jgi:4'-phosphopantetheinyl transferase